MPSKSSFVLITLRSPRSRTGRRTETGAEHLPALVLVRRGHHHHVRHATQVRQVEVAGMRRAVGADHAAAVDRERRVQVLDRDVVDRLVVAALQEGRIDRHHRLGAFAGHAGGERDRMLLGDRDIEVAFGKFLRKAHQAGAFAHRRRDASSLSSGAAMSHSQSPKMSVGWTVMVDPAGNEFCAFTPDS